MTSLILGNTDQTPANKGEKIACRDVILALAWKIHVLLLISFFYVSQKDTLQIFSDQRGAGTSSIMGSRCPFPCFFFPAFS